MATNQKRELLEQYGLNPDDYMEKPPPKASLSLALPPSPSSLSLSLSLLKITRPIDVGKVKNNNSHAKIVPTCLSQVSIYSR